MSNDNDNSNDNEQRYNVRFEYPDDQRYDSGAVYMTIEQAAKVQEFLSAIETNGQISDVYVGEYHEWEESFAELLTDLDQFKPDANDMEKGFSTPEIKTAWDALQAVKPATAATSATSATVKAVKP